MSSRVSAGIASAPTGAAQSRMTWLDANRVFAALGVVLIHSTTDFAGEPFAQATPSERIVPALLRTVGELSGSELFLVFSLFLLVFKLERRDLGYGAAVTDQARRLLIPFVAWTLFYAFFRLLKADAFGYESAILAQLSQWWSWLGYFLLGSAQYHLHFLPTLFFIILLYPMILGAVRYPLAGLAIFPLLYAMDSIQGWLWGHTSDPVLRDYLLRFVKIVGYTGYGLLAAGVYGLWKRGLDRADCRLLRNLFLGLGLITFLAMLVYTGEIVESGRWGIRPSASFFAHLLMPGIVFILFLSLQYREWPPRYSRLARFTFGIYLIHPIFIDAYDILLYRSGWQLDPTVMVVTKYLFAVPASFALAYALSKIRFLAWLIGLGPVPFLPPHGASAGAAERA